jgi:hypothetical protein
VGYNKKQYPLLYYKQVKLINRICIYKFVPLRRSPLPEGIPVPSHREAVPKDELFIVNVQLTKHKAAPYAVSLSHGDSCGVGQGEFFKMSEK